MTDQFFDYLRYEKNRSENTVERYAHSLRDFEKYFIGEFMDKGASAQFWAATEYDAGGAYFWRLTYDSKSFDKILDTKDSGVDFGIGVAPGIAIPLNESLSFVAHLGSFGYYGDTISFGVNANNVLCGLYYSF